MGLWGSWRRASRLVKEHASRAGRRPPRQLKPRRARGLRLEQFEDRLLLSISPLAPPQLVAVFNDAGAQVDESDVFFTAPKELLLRFSEGQSLDATTLGAIQVYRAGGDGIWGNSNDVQINTSELYHGLGDNPNEARVRFAGSLPDDLYQVRIIGSGSSPLRNSTGVAFHDGADLTLGFELDLAPQVTAVVPQPITRQADGSLSQARNQIEVYFNNDALNPASAENIALYQLVRTHETASSVDDDVEFPVLAVYDAAAQKVTLTFADDLSALGMGTFRLRIGDAYGEITTTAVSLSEAGSSFFNAASLGTLGQTSAESQIVSAVISNSSGGEYYALEYPGAVDEPGQRDLPDSLGIEDHYATGTSGPEQVEGISLRGYCFPTIYAYDATTHAPMYNLITEAQKQRVREIFSLYSHYLGIEFYESTSGIRIVNGDLKASGEFSGPGGVAGLGGSGGILIDAAEGWTSSEFGGDWFQVALHEIGHVLGLGHAYDLPAGTAMGGSPGPSEAVFPGDYDILHGQSIYIPESVDVDLYQFTLAQAGTFSAEILAERMSDASFLDSLVTLYRVDSNGSTVVARNDDYFSKDSFLNLYLEPGTYYVGVSASGNDAYDPQTLNSGMGGLTEGQYQLRVTFLPGTADSSQTTSYLGDSTTHLVDAQRGVLLDGDADGVPGGIYDFWFQVQTEANTIYVDKVATGTPNGSLTHPYTSIAVALAVAQPGQIVRIVGNHTANDGPASGSVLTDNLPYQIGLDKSNLPLEDGETMEIPQGVTVMIDAGAVLKLRKANIDVGTSALGTDRSLGALQVLGTPHESVYFTSYYDDGLGGNSDHDGVSKVARAGDWGGLVFRNDMDYEDGNDVLESEGIFLNYVNHADIAYAGGEVNVDGIRGTYAPLYLIEARPTISFNYLHGNASAPISADPNSFQESHYQSWGGAGLYTAEYDRVGPEVYGNRLLGNSINGLFVRVRTALGQPIHELEVSGRFDDTDIVHVVSEILYIDGTPGGATASGGQYVSRLDASLVVDPGMIVKLDGARIEVEMGAQLIAEGRAAAIDEAAGAPVIFTSLLDNRYGAGGIFQTGLGTTATAAPGDWSGIYFSPTARGSLDQAVVAYAGGSSAIEGGFASFDPVEIRQAEVRIAHTDFENNRGAVADGERSGRGSVVPATIYVLGAQPILVDNEFSVESSFFQNAAYALAGVPVISINANALSAVAVTDWGRSTGTLAAYDEYRGNFGPLVRGNRMSGNGINGMVVRGATLTTESIWDDTDIVHVLLDEIVVPNYEHGGGLRLQSSAAASLVVKLGSGAGLTASGTALEIDDRIGGTLQIVGTASFPVVLTSLKDDTVGAGYDLDGVPLLDTNGDGAATVAAAGDWRSVKLAEYSNDRNVAVFYEGEVATGGTSDANSRAAQAQYLGQLATSEASGSDNLRLGFDVSGSIAYDRTSDVDVYSFNGTAGTEVWFDIDRTTYSLDTILELVDSKGKVLARSDNSYDEMQAVTDTLLGISPLLYATTPVTTVRVLDENPWVRSVATDGTTGYDLYSTNARDAGMRLVLPGTTDEVRTYYVRLRSALAIGNIPAAAAIVDGTRFTVSTGGTVPRLVTFEFDKDASGVAAGITAIPLAGSESAEQVATLITTAINVAMSGAATTLTARVAGSGSTLRVVLDGTSATFQAGTSGLVEVRRSGGQYNLQIRLGEEQEVAGSTVRYADLRYATDGIEALGLPNNSPLLGDTAEVEAAATQGTNDTTATAQDVGNLLASDAASISWRGYLTSSTDVDWYKMTIDLEGVQEIAGVNDAAKVWATIFDLDYADGMGRADLSLYVFDSTGTLILIGGDSNVADDQATPIAGASLDDLSRGSEGPLDPFIGSVYMPEKTYYYVAVTSVFATPDALNQLVNTKTRVEPIDSVTRIAEDHVETVYPYTDNPTVTYTSPIDSTLSLGITADPFTLADVTTYVLAGKDLYTINPYSGTLVVDCTGEDATLPIPYGGMGMGVDAKLYAIGNEDGAVDYRIVDTGNATQTASVKELTLRSYIKDTTKPGWKEATENPRFYVRAMTKSPDPNYPYTFVVGNCAGDTAGAYATNMLWVLDANGDPLQTEGGAIPFASLENSEYGIITGLTFMNNMLYAVSDKGDLYRIPGIKPGPIQPMDWLLMVDTTTGNLIPHGNSQMALTPLAPQSPAISFTGLCLGPQNVENGAYADMLFATDNLGRIWAMNTSGFFQSVFAPTATNNGGLFLETGRSDLHGLAFTVLDYNLWHVTKTRSQNAGHGINQTFDYSRPDATDDNERRCYGKPGYQSWYFGVENPKVDTPWSGTATAQPGAANITSDLYGTYDAPGGAKGRLTSRSFDLSNYVATDKPTLYFSYFAETEGGDQCDGIRVYVSGSSGKELVATNIDWADLTKANKLAVPGRGDQIVQKLYDSGDVAAAWRQARVDLSKFAGQSGLKLVFEFTTQGVVDSDDLAIGQDNHYEGVYLDDIIIGFAERGEMVTAAPAAVTGYSFTPPPTDNAHAQPLNGSYQLEVRRGADYGLYFEPQTSATHYKVTYVTPRDTNARDAEGVTLVVKAGSALVNGTTFRISDGLSAETFILVDYQNPVATGTNTPILFSTSDSVSVIAQRIAWAVNSSAQLDVTASTVVGRVDLFGAVGATGASGVDVFVLGLDDLYAVKVDNLFLGSYVTYVDGYDLGDSNLERPQGEVLLENNTIRYSSDYGIVVASSVSEDGLNHPAAGRALNVTNDLVPGLTIQNNLLLSNQTGGIRISGSDEEGQAPGAIPYVDVLNNTISGGEYSEGGTEEPVTFIFPNGPVDITAVNTNANQLRDALLGSGITVVGDATFLGGESSAGFWSDGAISGIILSTGDVNYAEPPNTAAKDGSTGYASQQGDADLDQANGFSAGTTKDTTYLKFDFQSEGGSLYFNFVFASEEYNEFVKGGFNDVFAFFLDGVNVALIPGTTTPVGVDNVNGGNPFGTGATNSQYYHNNDPSEGGKFLDVVGYDGFTDVFTVQSTGLAAGTHTIKLVISDVGDRSLDSAVFIQGGTFSDKPAGYVAAGAGILVENNASPTILNNIIVNSTSGIKVDSTSTSTVLGGNVYQNNTNNVVINGVNYVAPGTFDVALSADNPLFVDEINKNFYLAANSAAIDSAVEALPERFEFAKSVLEPLGLIAAPTLAPDYDLDGQLRQDDPDVPGSGQGQNVFKDRGALERADFDAPTVSLASPLDNEAGVDRDSDPSEVVLVGQNLTEFALQFRDGTGVGIDDFSVTAETINLYRDDVLLWEGTDYLFQYDAVHDLLHLYPVSGFWSEGYEYRLYLNNEAIRDQAGNRLEYNRPDGTTEVVISLAGLDFGDAPDALALADDYPSYLASDGARHVVFSDYYLGSGISGEKEAKANSTATGDPEDDGVTFSSYVLSNSTMSVTVVASGAGYLNAWIDFNHDGQWSANEQIFGGATPTQVVAGSNKLTFTVPVLDLGTGVSDLVSYARFRFSHQANLGVTGEAPDGEVEDYAVHLVTFLRDYGDAPSSYHSNPSHEEASHALVSNLHLGSTSPDADMGSHPSGNALGDDSSGVDDEDGVNLYGYKAVFSAGRTVTVGVDVAGTASVAGTSYLNVWLDVDCDGDWSDADEQVVKGLAVSDGLKLVSFAMPGDAVIGSSMIRFRLSTEANLSWDGLAPNGEVEDYAVQLIGVPYDFGDAPASYGTTLAQNGARQIYDPSVCLGTDIDYDSDGLPSSTATGDDTNNSDDEDGVTFPKDSSGLVNELRVGQNSTITVVASTAGYLNAWLDLNGDGDWSDAGEQIFTNSALKAGTNSLIVSLSRDLTTVNSFARFRFTKASVAQPSPTGPAQDAQVTIGEVEDYAVQILAGTAQIRGSVFNDLNASGTHDNDTLGALEPGFAGKTVQLYREVAGVRTWVATTTTDSLGAYAFTKLFGTGTGETYVVVPPATETGWVRTVPTSPADGSSSVTISSQGTATRDFGYYRTPHVQILDTQVLEGNNGTTTVYVTVQLTESFGAAVQVQYQTENGTAIASSTDDKPDDYVPASGTLTFQPQAAPAGVWTQKTLTKNNYNDYDYKAVGDNIVWAAYDGVDWDVFLYNVTTATTTQLSTSPSDDRYPALSDRYVVWSGKLAGESDFEIFAYNLQTGVTTQLTNNTIDDLEPAISGTTVVWTSAESSDKEIYKLVLPSDGSPIDPTKAVNLSNNTTNDSAPQIVGSRVVWTCFSGYGNDIMLYDPAVSSVPQQVGFNYLEDRAPVLSDSYLVWETYDGNDYELLGYRFGQTSPAVRLTDDAYNDQQASLSGSKLVWRGSDGNDAEIFYYDLDNGLKLISDSDRLNLSNNDVTDERPQIVGDRIVWHSFVGSNWEVLRYDLDEATVVDVSQNSQYDWYPQLTESYIVWRSYLNNNYEIVLAKQETPQVTRQLTFSVVGDTAFEPDEQFYVRLTGATRAELVDNVATVTILNDDGALDYGDAPSPYPTLLADNGARHQTGSGFYLGSSVDSESNGQPSTGTNGDDIYLSDDEDGVSFPASLVAGAEASLSVTATCPIKKDGTGKAIPVTGRLSAWIDFNGDGDWNDVGEQIVVNQALTTVAGQTKVASEVKFYVPANVDTQTSYLRVRFAEESGLAPTGLASTGEVEDYVVQLTRNPYLLGQTVTIPGTTESDTFRFTEDVASYRARFGQTSRVTVGTVDYYYPTSMVSSIVLNCGTGRDKVILDGSAEADKVVIYPDRVHWIGTAVDLWAYGTEEVTATSGGGADGAWLYGSAGADTFVGSPTTATMFRTSGTTTLYSNTANGFRNVYAWSNGGADTATLNDSAGADTLVASPADTYLAGTNYLVDVKNFASVIANASGGGDRVRICDSAGDDLCTLSPTQMTMSSTSYSIVANRFPTVNAYANKGGNDTVKLYDSAADDVFIARTTVATMRPKTGASFNLQADLFENVTGYATAGGKDYATLYDGAGDDRFTGTPSLVTMAPESGSGYQLRAEGFEAAAGVASTGFNQAFLSDSSGDDTLKAWPTRAVLLGPTLVNTTEPVYSLTAYSFQLASTTAANGGVDSAIFYDGAGSDTFQADGDLAQEKAKAALWGTGFHNEAQGFDKYLAYAVNGGSDVAILNGTTGDDSFGFRRPVVGRTMAVLRNDPLFYFDAEAFERVEVHGNGGTKDTALVLDDVGGSALSAEASKATLSKTDLYFLLVDGFDTVTARSRIATNTKSVKAVDYVLDTLNYWTY